MSRHSRPGRLGVVFVLGVLALAGCAAMHRDADAAAPASAASGNPSVGGSGSTGSDGLPSELRPSVGSGSGTGAPAGWPVEVPFPEGAPVDGFRCSNRFCRVWFGLMPVDDALALRKQYLELIRNSGKWEQLGTPEGLWEDEAYRYKGASTTGCGYTWEISQGQIPNDLHRRWRVFISLTW